ncbi:MAG: SpoIIE family protein phosphatase [Bacteroidales bacterium]
MNSQQDNLGSIYFQNAPYPVCFISRDRVLEGNKSFIHHFGDESIHQNVFSIFSIYDKQNHNITTLLDIALNKIYLFNVKKPRTDWSEGKIFFNDAQEKDKHYLTATILFSHSNEIDLATELALERKKRTESEDELKQYIEELEAIDDALEESNQRFAKMSDLIPQTIYETDINGNIIFLNAAGKKILGYNDEDLKEGIEAKKLFIDYDVEKAKQNLQKIMDGHESHGNEYLLKTKNHHTIPVRAYASRIMKGNNPVGVRGIFIDITEQKQAKQQIEENLELIKYQKQELEEQYRFVTRQNMEIVESMNYARRIQNALLPSEDTIKKLVKEYFVLFKPKEIVSGDFYWVTHKKGKIMMAAADCTGHGIPGAFMSMLGIAFLNEIANTTKEPSPANMLNILREHVIHTLKQDEQKITTMDGLDIALCVIDTDKNEIQFSGANNPLYVVHNGELIEYPADKMPIGYAHAYHKFTNKTLKLVRGDTFYIFSDGYMDQFGGKKNKKFKPHRFKQLIKKIHDKPMNEQKEILYVTLEEWKGEQEQMDDIIIIGFRY